MTRLTFTLLSLLTIALLVAGAFWLSRLSCIYQAMGSLEQDPINKATLWWNSSATCAGAWMCGILTACVGFASGQILTDDRFGIFRKPTP